MSPARGKPGGKRDQAYTDRFGKVFNIALARKQIDTKVSVHTHVQLDLLGTKHLTLVLV